MSEPVRTCVGCRQRAAKRMLVRVVQSGADLVVDERQVLAGRGAYLHRDLDCFDRAERKRAFGRALRTERIDAEQLAELRARFGPVID